MVVRVRRSWLTLLVTAFVIAGCTAAESSADASAASEPAAPASEGPSEAPSAEESVEATSTPVPDLGAVTVALGAHVASLWPVTVADGAGFFGDEGLEPEIVITQGGANTMAAIQGGSADFGAVPYSDVMLAAEQGAELVAVAALVSQYTTDAVISAEKAAELGIDENTPFEERFENIDGLRIAINAPGSGQDKLIRLVLEEQGIDPDNDVQIVGLGNDGMLPGFTGGQVDAFVNSSPTTDQGIAGGGVWWFRPSQGEVESLDGMTYTVLAARADFVEENPEITAAVVRAITSANRLLAQDDEASLEVLTQAVELDPEVLETAYRSSQASYPEDAVITEAGFQQNVDFLTAFGDEVTVSFEDVTRPEFGLEAAED